MQTDFGLCRCLNIQIKVASLKAGVLSGDRGRSQAGRLLRIVLPRERWSFVMFQRRKTE